MIAANFKKHPDAMALQLPLPFGTRLVWHTSRPTTRIGRLFRAAVAAAMARIGRVVQPVAASVPQWWRDAKKAAQALAASVKAACIELAA